MGPALLAVGYPPTPSWWQLLSAIPYRHVHLDGRIGTSAAFPWKSPAGGSGVWVLLARTGDPCTGKNLQRLVLNPSAGFAPAWSQVPAVTGNASAVARAPGCPANNAGRDGTHRGTASPEHRGSGRTPRKGDQGVEKLWSMEGGGVGGPPPVIRAAAVTLCGPVSLSRLCLRPSPSPRSPAGMFPPGSGSWLGKAVIYLQTCLVASPGRGRARGGDVVAWRLAGLLQGPGVRHSRALVLP